MRSARERALLRSICICVAWVFLGWLLLLPPLARAKSMDPVEFCRSELNKRIAACVKAKDPYHDGRTLGQGDFTIFAQCRSEQQKSYDDCLAASSPDICDREAKTNIDWVLFRDAGARASYERFRAQGQSPLDAVISAQAHNPRAQQSIRRCRDWAQHYIASHINQGGPAGRAGAGPPAAGGGANPPGADPGSDDGASPPDRRSVEECTSVTVDMLGGTQLVGSAANNCGEPVKVSICYSWEGGWRRSEAIILSNVSGSQSVAGAIIPPGVIVNPSNWVACPATQSCHVVCP